MWWGDSDCSSRGWGSLGMESYYEEEKYMPLKNINIFKGIPSP